MSQSNGSPTFITPLFANLPAGATSVQFTTNDTESLAVVLAGILQNPSAPAQPNLNWPAIKVEVALGYQPGDPTAVPQWTDITRLARQPDGSTTFSSSRGKAYELVTPEAGSITIQLDNSNGDLNPGNPASLYYPYITDMLLLKVSGYWDGQWYTIAKGWWTNVSQQWPDPQYGFVPVTAYDSMGVLANYAMLSAYSSEVMLDTPYSYWTLNEGYTAANGQPFRNLGVNNANPLLGLDGGSDATGALIPLSCGQALNMLGDQGSGIGISGLSAPQHAWSAGAIGIDSNFPNLTSGVTVEFWTNIAASTYEYVQPLITLLGRPCNYSFEGGAGRVQVNVQYVPPQPGVKNSGTAATLWLTIQDFQGNKSSFHVDGLLPMDGNPHHHVFTLSGSKNFTVNYYLDGVQVNGMSGTTSGVGTNNDVYAVAVGPATDVMLSSNFAWLEPLASDYAIGHVAVYPRVLPVWRISTHFDVGAGSGGAGDSAVDRFKRVLAYSQTGVAKAGDTGSPSPLIGAADQLDGGSALDGLGAVTSTEGGIVYAAGDGTVFYQSRTALYNKPPQWVFGDNPANGEIVYDPGMSFDLDVTYLYNSVTATRQAGRRIVQSITSQGVTTATYTDVGAEVTATDVPSTLQFMPRNKLEQTVVSQSDQDAYDRANWSLAKYKEPAFRLPQIVLRPSETGMWAAALGIEQGDVVSIIRRPVGAAAYAVLGVVQRIEHNVGPGIWETTIMVSPVDVEQNVLQIGATSGFNTLGSNRVAW